MSFSHAAKVWRLVSLTAIGLFLVSVLAEASPIAAVQIINTNGGRILTAHANRYGDTVYVGGLADRPAFAAPGAHVHVWGLGKNNQAVFAKSTPVTFTGNPSLIHTGSYVVSISAADMQKAKTVFVSFHDISHADSKAVQ